MTGDILEKRPRASQPAYWRLFSEANDTTARPWFYIPWKHLLVILICGYFLFFFRIGEHDLWNPDEARYAQVAREMLHSGDWIVLHLNGKIYTEKPPLYFWSAAVLSRPFGDVSETTARLPSALAVLFTLLVTYLLGGALIGQRGALLGTLAMATTAQFIWIGRIGVLDMLMALFILTALALFYAGYERRNAILYLSGFLSLAPAALSKGPAGVAVPIIVMLVFLAIEMLLRKDGAGRELLRFGLCTLAGLGLVALIIVPWWRAAYERSGGVYGSFSVLLKQTRGRMIESYSHRQSVFYYFNNVLWQFMPWTVFIPLTAYAVREKGNLREHRGLRFLVVWFAAVFVFFTVISGKRSQYILPLFPAAGLLAGWALAEWGPLEGRLRERKEFLVPLVLLLVVSAAGLVTFPVAFHIFLPKYFWIALPVVIVAAVVLFLAARAAPRRPPAFAVTFLVVASVILAVAVFGYVATAVDTYKSARPFCSGVQTAMEPDDAVFFYRVYRPNINYYMGRNMKRLNTNEEVLQALDGRQRVFLVLEQRRLKSLDLGDSFVTEQVVREQVGSRDMVCVVARRTRLARMQATP